MKEYLYNVGARHKKTGEKISVQVWAKNCDEATHKLTGVLIGYYCEYEWTGTGPAYEDHKIITRRM